MQGFLPLETAPRDDGEGKASSFVVGAYCKGGLVGLRKRTTAFVWFAGYLQGTLSR